MKQGLDRAVREHLTPATRHLARTYRALGQTGKRGSRVINAAFERIDPIGRGLSRKQLQRYDTGTLKRYLGWTRKFTPAIMRAANDVASILKERKAT